MSGHSCRHCPGSPCRVNPFSTCLRFPLIIRVEHSTAVSALLELYDRSCSALWKQCFPLWKQKCDICSTVYCQVLIPILAALSRSEGMKSASKAPFCIFGGGGGGGGICLQLKPCRHTRPRNVIFIVPSTVNKDKIQQYSDLGKQVWQWSLPVAKNRAYCLIK